eukprot:3696144-Rhodomonas_salina.1
MGLLPSRYEEVLGRLLAFTLRPSPATFQIFASFRQRIRHAGAKRGAGSPAADPHVGVSDVRNVSWYQMEGPTVW